MSVLGWTEKLKSYFLLEGALYIAIDDNNVLTSTSVFNELGSSKLQLVNFDDPIELRYLYEQKFRHLSKEKRKSFIIIIRSAQFTHLPYDIIESAHRVDITLDKLFPLLDCVAMSQCPAKLYKHLFDVQVNVLQKLNYNETLIFILEQLLEESLMYINNDVSILKAVLRYYNQHNADIPSVLLNALKEYLKKKRVLINLNSFDSFYSKEQLRRYLNACWRKYVFQKEDSIEPYVFSYFEDSQIQLIIHEWLDPIEIKNDIKVENWMKPSIFVKEGTNSCAIDSLNTSFESFSYKEWGEFASKIGKLKAATFEDRAQSNKTQNLIDIANLHFKKWMQKDYGSLASLPAFPKPKMMHHILSYLSKAFHSKLALIVMDGMSYTQWEIIRENLKKDNWKFEETPIFSWVPSITSVARQSIFSGKTPREFANSINTTNKEEFYWKEFWKSKGLHEQNISYQRALGLHNFEETTFNFEKTPFVTVFGAVIDVIDEFMHGAKQGGITVNSELENWLKANFLHQFIGQLSQQGFEIYLTADHGNLECVGRGRINQGVTVESAAQRLRVYKSEKIRLQTSIDHKDTLIWDNPNLPDDYFVLLAENNRAFVPKNDKIVSHGGIHIEEMIVPFVKIYR